LTRSLLNSRTGRTIRSLKGGTLAAESCGIDNAHAKNVAFVYAAVLAAVSGWLYAHLQRAVNPTPFNLEASIEYLLMVVAGGAGSVWGAIAGSVLVTLLKDQLQNVLPLLFGSLVTLEIAVFGAILIVILQTAREGLWPPIASWLGFGGSRHLTPSFGKQLPAPSFPAVDGPLLEARGLQKAFGGLVAVDDFSISIDAGEIVGLIGPNGAGKSTTFAMLSGAAVPSAGEIYLRGKRVDGLPARAIARLGIARTFQHVKLVAGMSVIENAALGAHLRGNAGAFRGMLALDREEEASLFAEAARQLDRAGLGDVLYMPADTLALGQQRIVEIARALCLGPVLLLLDEPAAGLRYAEKQALSMLLKSLQAEGIAILLVEHDMDFVMGVADRLVVLNFGSKLAEGAPAEVRTNTAVIDAYLGSAA
jgi:branched-chain amino acid transport system permease protein